MTAFWAVIAALAAAIVIAGCDAVKSAAARAGLTGFEARCEAALPATRIDVVTAPVVPSVDRTRSWRELTSMSGDAGSELRALGLTLAQVGHKASVETSGIENQRDGRVCVRPSVKVELSAMPVTVYIGREIAGDPCREAVALEHEMKHVTVYANYLSSVADDLRSALRAEYGNKVFQFRDRAQAKREMDDRLSERLRAMLADNARRAKALQQAVDSPEEYARTSTAVSTCPGQTLF